MIHLDRKASIAMALVLIVVFSGLAAIMHANGQRNAGVSSPKVSYKPSTTHYYPIRLVEHGLPEYWYWYAEIGPANGTNYGSYSPTDAKTMTYYESPGNYSLEVWAYGYNYQTQKAFYHANVVNSIVVVNVTFIEQYNVTVFEKGLPNGTGWEMNLIPDVQYPPTYSASTPPFRKSLWTWVPNGTYTLQVGEMEDYQLTPYAFSTQVNVNGSNLNYTIPFNGVKITESGLDNNTSWGLYRSSGYGSYIAGPTTNRSISLYLPAGGLKMRFVADGYYSSTLNFNNDVPNRTVIAHFEKGYNVTFVEHGLPDIAHNSWYVKGFAVAFHGGNSYIYGKNSSTFLVPDGTYGYNISFGQQAWDVNGNMYLLNITRNATGSSFTVDGSNVTVNVYFNAVVVKNLSYRPPVTAGKLVLYAFMGFIAAGVAVEAIYFRRRRI